MQITLCRQWWTVVLGSVYAGTVAKGGRGTLTRPPCAEKVGVHSHPSSLVCGAVVHSGVLVVSFQESHISKLPRVRLVDNY